MTIAAFRKTSLAFGACVAIGATLLTPSTAPAATPPAHAGRQLWKLSDYTTIELVAREPGAPANQHPFVVEPNTLHAWLQQISVVRDGADKPLFAIDELSNIVPSLAEALARVQPDQDVALVSAARHEDNSFFSITAVTARFFAVDGHLNVIVHDARYDFFDTARGTGMAPHFTVGSRTAPGTLPVRSASATNVRADWLVLATAAPAAAVPAAPAAPVAPAMAAPVAPPAAPVPPVPQDAEQRLSTLKRLYDKGLITKPEYEQKRAEILKTL